MKRQPLYACLSCVSTKGECGSEPKLAGVCLACSYHCHEGCDLVELYTKRNFRCDCGNAKFGGKKCGLEPQKQAENEDQERAPHDRQRGETRAPCQATPAPAKPAPVAPRADATRSRGRKAA